MNVVRIDARPAPAPTAPGPEASAPALRARQLLSEARAAAAEHLELLQASIEVVRGLSLDVRDGGEAFPVGLRELAAQLAEDLLWRGKTIDALAGRERAGLLAH